MSWCNGLEAICRPDAPLRDFTWYRLGGPARWLVEPRDPAELREVVLRLKHEGVPWNVLGQGANVLVPDEGYPGAVIRLSQPAFLSVNAGDETITVGAGVDGPRLIRRLLADDRVGLEVLAGIPGTVGGFVRMNAGGRHGSISQFVRTVEILDAHAELRSRDAAEVGFTYRRTALDGAIVLFAVLAVPAGDGAAAMERHRMIWNQKAATQPAMKERSAGCIFKNPPQAAAGALLDAAGLKGVSRGGARFSEKHANFIVAEAGASTRDVVELIELARERVRATHGIELQLEVDAW